MVFLAELGISIGFTASRMHLDGAKRYFGPVDTPSRGDCAQDMRLRILTICGSKRRWPSRETLGALRP